MADSWLSTLITSTPEEGFALAVKFTAVFLIPTLAALLALHAWKGGGSWRRAALGALGAGAVAALVLWACYGFPGNLNFYLDGLRKVTSDHFDLALVD